VTTTRSKCAKFGEHSTRVITVSSVTSVFKMRKEREKNKMTMD
jgi:hypothetical protein